MGKSYTCPMVNARIWEHPGFVNSAHTAPMPYIHMKNDCVDKVQQFINGIVRLRGKTPAEAEVDRLLKDKQGHYQPRLIQQQAVHERHLVEM